MNNNWYERPIQSLFVLCCITLLFLIMIKNISLGQDDSEKYIIYTVEFEYYGMDENYLEKEILIPLEEIISGISGLVELKSIAEYGKTYTTAYFHKNLDSKYLYLALRDGVDTLYNRLPSAVQKPRIYSSDSNQSPMLCFALEGKNLNQIRNYLDTEIKPLLEGIDGVAEVIVAGGTTYEILVEFDVAKMAKGALNPLTLGQIIQEGNSITSGGSLNSFFSKTQIAFDTKIKNLDEIRHLPIPVGNGVSKLSSFASVERKERKQDEIVRINGKECVSLVVKATFDGNPIYISKKCKEILNTSPIRKEGYTVLYDKGEEFAFIIKNAFISLLQSFIVILFIVPFFFINFKISVLLGILLPVSAIWTTAQLYFFGFNLDKNVLAGLGIALGLVADGPFVMAELSEKSIDKKTFFNLVYQILPSIISSCLTTVLTLIPVYFLSSIIPGIQNVTLAIILMLCNSTILTCVFLPCFIFLPSSKRKSLNFMIYAKLKRSYLRILYFIYKKKGVNKKLCISIMGILIVLPFVFFVLSEKNITLEDSQNIIFASVEYDSEIAAEVIDKDVSDFIEEVKKLSGVEFIRSQVVKGNCSLEIGLQNDACEREVSNKLSNFEHLLQTGFLYVPQKGQTDSVLFEIQVAVVGDESQLCRKYAEQAVSFAQGFHEIEQCVLNFKNPEEILRITPDRNLLAKNNLSVNDLGTILRWVIFGPVVDKWINDFQETDIRVSGKKNTIQSLEDLENLVIPVLKNNMTTDEMSKSLRLGNLAKIEKDKAIGKIYRLDNRRAAYCTFHVKSSSTEKAMVTVEEILNQIELEKGYGFRFSKELENMKKNYSLIISIFCLCIIGILMLLGGLTENYSLALKITALIPSSMGIPMAIRFFFGGTITTADIIGLVIASGLAVNNGIYIAESKKYNILLKIREKTRSILITSLSTIIGAIPLLFFGADDFSKQLAFFMIFGTGSSMIISFLLFPVMIQKNATI